MCDEFRSGDEFSQKSDNRIIEIEEPVISEDSAPGKTGALPDFSAEEAAGSGRTGSRKGGISTREGVILPHYGYYAGRGKRRFSQGPGRHGKSYSGKGARGGGSLWASLLKTAALAVLFGLVAGIVMRSVLFGGKMENRESQKGSQLESTEPVSSEPSERTARDDQTNSPAQADPAVKTNTTGTNAGASQEIHGNSRSSGTGKGAVADVAAECMSSVVAITTVSIQEIPSFFGYGSTRYESASSGSGIIVGENEEELLIATNNHVVSGASTLSVLFIGGEEDGDASSGLKSFMEGIADDLNYDGAVSASVKGTDFDNDLAVVAVSKSDIPAGTMDRIRVASLGNSDDLAVGEQVVAIGNALGYGQSVTSGWISALNRTISTSTTMVSGLIQTDAAINPGNSGGALLNMNGEVVGINSAKYADSNVEGMGYAIPISKASPILNELMTKETRVKQDSSESAYMGVSVADMGIEASLMYGIPDGAFVAESFEGGAAYNAGIRQGDIIVRLDGNQVQNRNELIEMLSYYSAGEQVAVVIARKNSMGLYEEETVVVTMGARPTEG